MATKSQFRIEFDIDSIQRSHEIITKTRNAVSANQNLSNKMPVQPADNSLVSNRRWLTENLSKVEMRLK